MSPLLGKWGYQSPCAAVFARIADSTSREGAAWFVRKPRQGSAVIDPLRDSRYRCPRREFHQIAQREPHRQACERDARAAVQGVCKQGTPALS